MIRFLSCHRVNVQSSGVCLCIKHQAQATLARVRRRGVSDRNIYDPEVGENTQSRRSAEQTSADEVLAMRLRLAHNSFLHGRQVQADDSLSSII